MRKLKKLELIISDLENDITILINLTDVLKEKLNFKKLGIEMQDNLKSSDLHDYIWADYLKTRKIKTGHYHDWIKEKKIRRNKGENI